MTDRKATEAMLDAAYAAAQAIGSISRDSIEGYLNAALAASVSPPAAAQGWQPIETAPKDGTHFDAWIEPATGAGYRATSVVGAALGPKGWIEKDGARATHWMPLPAAPPSPALVPQAEKE